MPNYQKTKRACYMGFITQAIAAHFAPLLFLICFVPDLWTKSDIACAL